MAAPTNTQQQTAGIKISQFGYNAANCPDYDLLFNSSWPSLAIVFDQTAAYTTDSNGNLRIPHNLGFVPLAMAWQLTDSTMSVSAGRIFPSVDKQYIYFLLQLNINTTYYLNIKCYNLDITVPQNYTYIQPTAVNTPYDKTYGIKVVKQNQAITSNDMRSFILHSRTASPQVLSVVTEKTPYNAQTGIGLNGTVLTYTNPQNYTPWAFGYAQVNAFFYNVPVYQWAPPVSQSFPILQFNGGNYGTGGQQGILTLNIGPGTGKGSVVVLRDPLLAANSLQVQY